MLGSTGCRSRAGARGRGVAGTGRADVAVAAEAIGAGLGGALTNLRSCLAITRRHLPAGVELSGDFDRALAAGSAARTDVAMLAQTVEER